MAARPDLPPATSVPAPTTNHQTRAAATRTTSHDNREGQDPSTGSRITADISLRQAALAGGLGLLLLGFLPAIANFGVLKTLIVPGDAQSTAQNIAAGQGLFRLGISAFSP